MKYFAISVLSVVILCLFHSCNGNEMPVPEIKDISLSISELQFEKRDNSVETVIVECEDLFQVDPQPEWLVLDVDQKERTIKVSVKPNYTKLSRELQLKVFDANSDSYLHIKQLGEEEEKEPFLFVGLPVSNVYLYRTSKVDGKTLYNLKASHFFINEDIKNDIYLGNVINSKFSSLSRLQTCEDYMFSNVTVLPFETIHGEVYFEKWKTPSKLQMDMLVQRTIDAVPKQSRLSFIEPPTVFRSYKYLHFLSMANLGFPIDGIMYNDLLPDRTMDKDIGLIYSYSEPLYTFILDFSSLDPKDTKEETVFTVENNLSYINQVIYGKTAFLVAESNGSEEDAKSVIEKISRKENLTESDKLLINNMNVYYLYFSTDGVLQKDKSIGNIEKISNYFGIEYNSIIPLNFSVANYPNSGRREIEYSIVN